jgi:hypothetical protein
MRRTSGIATMIVGFLLISCPGMFIAHTANAVTGQTNDGPTQKNALEVFRY